MKLLIQLYKNEIAVFSLVVTLFIWGVVTSYLAFKNNPQVVLIGKTEGSYQLIVDEEMTPIETGNFIRHFLSLTLNFNDESYRRHISLAGDLMTEKLWRSRKPEFIKMAGFIKKHKVTQSAEVLKIQKNEKGFYEVKVRNYLFKKGILTEKDKLILLSLVDNERSFENPWSLSVSSVEVK